MTACKRFSFLLIYLMILLPIIGLFLGGWLTFLSFLSLFTLIPLADTFIRDTSNPSKEEEKKLSENKYFKYITYFYVPAQLFLLAYGAFVVSRGHLSWYEWLGFTMSVGLTTGGVGINLAHELMHKSGSLQQFLSKTLLVTVCYGHFFIEHVRGHHVRVATPDDPATAQLGESFYHFFVKSLFGSFQSAIHLEKKRLERKNFSLWSIHNHFWWIIGIPLILAAMSFVYGGTNTLAFFLLQSFIAILMLELVNYIEHYGLQRKKEANGQYEKVNPFHSWNADHWLSNAMLLPLQRHSDHHTYGARPYQILRHSKNSPQLPSGYIGMIPLALIPPLWRLIMDKRVMEYREQLTQSEVQDQMIKQTF